MRRGLIRALLSLTAVMVGAGCITTRGAQVEGTGHTTAAEGTASLDPFEQTHPEPDLEERIAQAVTRRGDGAETGDAQGGTGGHARHTVEPGQTVYRISVMNGITPEALMAANGITDPTTLKVGQVLVVPRAAASGSATKPASGSKTTVATTTPKGPAARPKPLRDREATASKGQLEWPLRGVLYARFGKKGNERHDGIDLAAPRGTPVRAAAPGIVLFAGQQPGYGHIVLIEHANGLITLYAHNATLTVKTGDVIKPRQQVATVGESGRTSGPHLHFEVRQEGFAVDPLLFLGDVPAS